MPKQDSQQSSKDPNDLLPLKEEGDSLGASHINELTKAARIILGHFGGSFGFQNMHGGSSPIPPFFQRLFIIDEEECDGETDQYQIKGRYWDNVANEWKTDEDGDGWCLDPTDVGLSFQVGDKLIAFFDPQRGAFIPILGGGGATKIYFRVQSVDCDADGTRHLCVLPLRTAPPCATIPGEDDNNQVLVYDNGLECILNQYTDDELVNAKGSALYTGPANTAGVECSDDGKWTLDSLCDVGDCQT